MVGLAALLGAVCAWALAAKALPWLYDDYGRIARLRSPVGYWNALALLGDVALPLGLCIATRWRMPGTLLVYGWTVAIALTYSRGGALVAVLAVAAWTALSRAWTDALATLVAAGVPAAGVLVLAFALPGISSDGQPHSTRVQDGIVFGLAVLAGGAVAAALARIPPPEPVPTVRRAALALLAAAAVAMIAVGAVHAHSWWDSFTSPTVTEISNERGRLLEGGSNYRWTWWKQGWHGFEAHPVGGTGAGTFALTNFRYRTSSLDHTIEPHSLPVQFLSETGAVGALLFVAAMAALVVRARRRTGPQLALALALPAYLVHGLIDVGWDFAAVSAPVFLAAGAVAARPAAEGARRLSAPGLLATGGVALALLFSLFAVWLGDRWTQEAYGEVDPARAVALAKRARSVNPLSVDALFAQAFAEQARGNDGEALALFERATRLQPENKETWFFLGTFNLDRGCPRTALPQLDRFTALDRQDPGNQEYDRALALVNAGGARC